MGCYFMATVVRYNDRDNPHYIRAFSNSAIFQISPHNDVVIDFIEEYVEPFLVTQRDFSDNPNIEYNHGSEEIIVIRERKCSITMSKKQALDMANWILNQYGGDTE